MPVWARPVRTLARSPLNASTLLSILCSVVFLRSAITMTASRIYPVRGSYVNQRALILAEDDAPQGILAEDVEHRDRQLLVAAQRQRRGVHHLELARDGLVEAEAGIARRARVVPRVGGIDAVHLGRLDHDLGPHFRAAQRRRSIGGEEGIAGAGGEDHHLALLEVAD